MTYQQKLDHWTKTQFPQRLLLSGFGSAWEKTIQIASIIQGVDATKISSGIHADTLCLADDGQSFKVGADHHPDRDTARGVIEWISQTPVSPKRIVILENIERASNTALQSLLKILEEPPKNAQFLITTQNHHRLLPTIISRVTTISLPYDFDNFAISTEVKDFLESPDLLLKFNQIERLRKEAKEDKESKPIMGFVDNLLLHARFFPQYQAHLESIFEARQNLQRNINAKLVLERLAIRLTDH